ncbi:hypothetical protein GALMADRAFT_251693, partial [Galerina marginata CBS 339.88]
MFEPSDHTRKHLQFKSRKHQGSSPLPIASTPSSSKFGAPLSVGTSPDSLQLSSPTTSLSSLGPPFSSLSEPSSRPRL